MTHSLARSLPARQAVGWTVIQLIALVATVALLIGLLVLPEPSLHLLWNILIPVLPATFLLSPALWRSVCPLATTNMMANGYFARRGMGMRASRTTAAIGVALLVLLVPARHFLFNTDGPFLAGFVAILVVVSLAAGAVFDAKAGFCNSICPVLPVEKLYGQHPLIPMRNPRCPDCTLCTAKGCIDLVPSKSILQTIGPARLSNAWLARPFGVFACAFPGFIVAYFLTTDGPLASAPMVYAWVLVGALASYCIAVALVLRLRIESQKALPILGAASVGIYYWFAAPRLAAAVALPSEAGLLLMVALELLVLVWLIRALRRTVHHPDRPHRSPLGSRYETHPSVEAARSRYGAELPGPISHEPASGT